MQLFKETFWHLITAGVVRAENNIDALLALPLLILIHAIVVLFSILSLPHLLAIVVGSLSSWSVPPCCCLVLVVWYLSLSFLHPCLCFVAVPVLIPVVIVLPWLSCCHHCPPTPGLLSSHYQHQQL